MLNSSTFSCGRYGYSLWPMWSFRVAYVIVADVVCGGYGIGLQTLVFAKLLVFKSSDVKNARF